MAQVKVKLLPGSVDDSYIKRWLPLRKRESHKGDYGKILLLCGSEGYTGAAALAAQAALRCGAGLVYLGVPRCVYPILAGKLTEAIVFPLPCDGGGLSERAIPEILERLQSMDACLLGCGLGRGQGIFPIVRAVLQQAKCPVVLDADGINVLAGHINVLREAACPTILTPHEGEFLRLGGETAPSRLAGTVKLSRMTGSVVLLKGYRTLICGRSGCYINRCGNPGMATGGSGDVLAGIITALLGQGLPPLEAAVLGARLHGRAGDLAAQHLGEYSLLPTDLIRTLPQLLK